MGKDFIKSLPTLKIWYMKYGKYFNSNEAIPSYGSIPILLSGYEEYFICSTVNNWEFTDKFIEEFFGGQ